MPALAIADCRDFFHDCQVRVAPLTLAMLAPCAFIVSDLKTGMEKSE
jgi:hypothetical protein